LGLSDVLKIEGLSKGVIMLDKSLMAGSTTMLVLNLLEQGDMYGYQMIRELEQRSEQFFSLKEGTLYPILHGLEKDGLINSYEMKTEQGRPRKYYAINDKGRRLLKDKKQEWQLFSSGETKCWEVSGMRIMAQEPSSKVWFKEFALNRPVMLL
jgi:PadR family transcriptional regulator PadR